MRTQRNPLRRVGCITAALAALSAVPAGAQSVTREACTTGDLTACAQVTLTAQAVSGGSHLSFAVRNLGVFGSLELASRPSIIWSLVFSTGRDAADLTETTVTPSGVTVDDASDWTFVDIGDQWQLTYAAWLDANFTTKGIGSNVAFTGTALDKAGLPWQQIGTTDANNSIAFSVFVPYAVIGSNFDWFRIVGLEATSLLATPDGSVVDRNGSCGVDVACGDVPFTAVPEPSSTLLLLLGTGLFAAAARRRRHVTQETP